jgi:hypothetical protein
MISSLVDVDLLVAVGFAAAISILVRILTVSGRLPNWWWGLAIAPLLSLGIALSVTLFPRSIPDGWQEGDFDPGFADFVALVFFGGIVPIAYLGVALPVAFIVRLSKTRRAKT